MATQHSPFPGQPRRSAFPSAIPSARRSSTSSNRPDISVASSPSPSPSTTSTPSGIPAFRSLRSLLPFGPNKHPAPVSNTASPSHHGRSPFANFSSVRRSMSMHRERKGPESADTGELPVLSIGRDSTALEEPAVRRSISYSNFEKDKPLPKDPPSLSGNPSHDDDDTILFSGTFSRFTGFSCSLRLFQGLHLRCCEHSPQVLPSRRISPPSSKRIYQGCPNTFSLRQVPRPPHRRPYLPFLSRAIYRVLPKKARRARLNCGWRQI
jgi:hypothetical protein